MLCMKLLNNSNNLDKPKSSPKSNAEQFLTLECVTFTKVDTEEISGLRASIRVKISANYVGRVVSTRKKDKHTKKKHKVASDTTHSSGGAGGVMGVMTMTQRGGSSR